MLEDDEIVGDDFESLYKGEISKSGTPILPSKRARKIPEKIQVSQDDLNELSSNSKAEIPVESDSETDVTLDELSEAEDQADKINPEDNTESNS